MICSIIPILILERVIYIAILVGKLFSLQGEKIISFFFLNWGIVVLPYCVSFYCTVK